jgi:hypothetical protein
MRQVIVLIGIISIYFLFVYNLFPIGIVGEVAASWTKTPLVIQETTPLTTTVLDSFGPFTLRSTRPILSLGSIPIAANIYTSAIPDWPSAILFSIFKSAEVSLLWPSFFGAFFLITVFWLLKSHLNLFHRFLIIGLLGSDWIFLFYKKALGGTETLLQLSWLLCIVALFQFQKKEDGSQLLGWGIGLGIFAKVTFILNLLPIAVAWILIRPTRYSLLSILKPILLCLFFPILTLILFWDIDIIVRSHDFLSLQWERIVSVLSMSPSPARENSWNIVLWMLDPLPFFEFAYQTPIQTKHWLLKGIGWIVALVILFSNRKDIRLQMITILLFSQVIILGLIAKDLHHLAMATPLFAIWLAMLTQHLSTKKTILFMLFWLVGNIQILSKSSSTIASVQTPSFTKVNQLNLVALLEKNSVRQLMTMDYEVYGVLEALAPTIEVTHTWAAISHERVAALPYLLKQSVGGHLLLLKSSSRMIYNLYPSENQLEYQARILGLKINLIENWNEKMSLYQVTLNEF